MDFVRNRVFVLCYVDGYFECYGGGLGSSSSWLKAKVKRLEFIVGRLIGAVKMCIRDRFRKKHCYLIEKTENVNFLPIGYGTLNS